MRYISIILCCSCIVAQIVGQLKPIEKTDNRSEELYQSIADIISFMKSKTIVTYFGESSSPSLAASFQQILMENKLNQTLIVAGPHTGLLRNLISSQNLALILFRSERENRTLDVLLNTLDGLSSMPIIFMYEKPVSRNLMKSLFIWSTKNQFFSPIVIFYRNQKVETWTFRVTPKFAIIRLKLSKLSVKFFRKYSNMNKYKAMVGLYQNVPEAFLVSLSLNKYTKIKLSAFK